MHGMTAKFAPVERALPVGSAEQEVAIGKVVDVPDLALNAALARKISLRHCSVGLDGLLDGTEALGLAGRPLGVRVEPRFLSHISVRRGSREN